MNAKSDRDNRPNSAVELGFLNFNREFKSLINSISSNKNIPINLPECLSLSLSNKLVQEAEEKRYNDNSIDAHPIAQLFYNIGCKSIDLYFPENRPISRFWMLETVARIPYFSFISTLHFYETLGWLRIPSLRKVHVFEEWNELHHLLIMESLGGNKVWLDRFIGYHLSIIYYWLLVFTYLTSPKIAYQFSELLETHAELSYAVFVEQNAEILKNIPAPDIAVKYYTIGDLYEFDDFQIERQPGTRRPPCNNLFDVFINIRDDEAEHVTTMKACQNYVNFGETVLSAHDINNIDTIDEITISRNKWIEWTNDINKNKKLI